jgi:para-nitrobenzyl esterase
MRRVLVGVACSLLLVAAGCDPLATPSGPAPLRYRDDVFTTVTTTADVTYGSAVDQAGRTVTLKLDVYEPAGDTVSRRPAIVWVHGGSFRGGSKSSRELVDEASTFARKGFVSVSIDYRLSSTGCPGSDTAACILAITQAREDAETAVRFLRANASRYRIDSDRIAIGGSSAGAITALNVGYSPENPSPGDHQGHSSAVRAVQSISGAELASGSTINAGDAPALLFQGTADPITPPSWAQSTVDRARAAGLVVVLRSWEGQGHVPYTQNRTQILDETRNFFYSQMDLANAAR